MRKNISVTIDEEHVVALDAEKDKYTTRSDVLNKILDAYFSAGLDPKDFSVGESSGMSVRTKLAVSTISKED